VSTSNISLTASTAFGSVSTATIWARGEPACNHRKTPAEPARVIEDTLDLTNVATTGLQSMLDEPECIGTDSKVSSIVALVHAVAGSKRFVHDRENSLLSVQLHLFHPEHSSCCD
jgi:hypothetical protein